MVEKITEKHPQINGWRKVKSWKRIFKNSRSDKWQRSIHGNRKSFDLTRG